MALTEIKIKNAKPKARSYKLADGFGMFLLVHPNGSKYWRLKYRVAGKEKLLALGVYPETSLSKAREERDKARKLLLEQADPALKKKEDKRLQAYRAGNSFAAVAKEWFETNKTKWVPDHAQRLWRRLELHIMPEIGSDPIAEIKPLYLLDSLRKIEKRGTTETAHRLLQTCNAIFRYGVITGRMTYNPAQDLRGALTPHRAQNHPTITAKELPDFFKRLEQVETSPQNKIAILMTMQTFVRQGELRHAEWRDIDWKEKEWRIRPETTKMKEWHIVPLSKQTLALLKLLKEITGHSAYLFPSQQRRKHAVMSENTVNKVLHMMGYKDRLVAHGFRALASTILNESSPFQKDAIERQLAHMERNQVRAAYNRAQYLDERRKMMQWWADYLEQRQRGKVLKIRGN
jgi:integrase